MSRAFFDSNILLYAIDRTDVRRNVAMQVIQDGGAISVQCLNEFVSVATRKLGLNFTMAAAARDALLRFCDPVIPLGVHLHHAGVTLATHYNLSVYDAMIVAAARQVGAVTLYSEDMQHGLVIDDTLRIVNPFA